MYILAKDIHRFCNCRNLQNPGTAFRCRGAWEVDRCEKRANILADFSRSYALYSPGSWISVPALCKSELFRSQPVLDRTNFLFDKHGLDRDKFYTTYSSKVPQKMSM